ncbi:MAG: hypothetical protein ACO1QB_18125, partial [Verrucomicrobiales bacterium]
MKRGKLVLLRSALCIVLFLFYLANVTAANPGFGWASTNSLALPKVGDHQLRILDPNLLELGLINTKISETSRVTEWDFVGENFIPKLPPPVEFKVSVNGAPARIKEVGFKRRPIYAPLKQRDLRIENNIYLVV